MTDPPPRPSRSPAVWIARAIAPGLLVSAGASAWCWWATGPGLGLFLGATLLVTLYTPPLVLAEKGKSRWLALGAIVCGVALTWAGAIHWADIRATEWLRCCAVVIAYAWALAGLAILLVLVGVSAPIASALTTVAGLLWLTWPVWLSHWLTQGLVSWLVPAHPLMAINSVVKHLGTWDRAPLAYRILTVLNQDVPYRLPSSIVPAALLHLLIGVPGMLITWRRRHQSAGVFGESAAAMDLKATER